MQLVRCPSLKCEGANQNRAWIMNENEKNSACLPRISKQYATLAMGFLKTDGVSI